MSIEKAFDEDSAKIASELSVNVISSFETETVDAFFSMAISPSSPHFPKKPSAGETFFKFDAEFLKTTFADISPPSLEDLPAAYIEDENCGRTAMPFKRGDIWESFTSNLASKSASKLALFIIAEAFSISASLRLASNFTEMPPTDGAHVALIKNSSGARFFGSAFIFAETVPSDGIKSEAIFSEEIFAATFILDPSGIDISASASALARMISKPISAFFGVALAWLEPFVETLGSAAGAAAFLWLCLI